MQRIMIIAATLLLGLTTLGCGRSPATPATKLLTNRQLEFQVLAKLNSDPEVKAANLLADVDVDSHQVILSGAVKSPALRKRAVDLAKAAQAGIIIVDRIEVRPDELARAEFTQQDAADERQKAKERGDKIGRSVSDAWIHLEIVSRLTSDEWGLEARSIHVDVLDGLVLLRGSIANMFAKEEIEQMADGIKGVRKVVDDLKLTHSS